MHKFSDIPTTSKIESLLRYKKVSRIHRWYPYLVQEFERELSYGILNNLNPTIRKNVSYSLQYLEYIELQLEELEFSDTLYCMIYKNYIITAASIIESIFYHVLSYHNKIKMQFYDKPKLHDVETFIKNGKTFVKVEGIKEKFDVPKESVQDFHFLIKNVLDGKYLAIRDSKRARAYISYCKVLRNRIHLHISQSPWTSDYHSFSHKEYVFVKYILFRILSDPLFGRNEQNIFPILENESLKMIIKNRYTYNG